MKRILIAVLLVLPVFLVAQGDTKKYQFGMKISPNINWLIPDTREYKNDGGTLGFGWGLIADINLTDNYYLGTGFSLSYLGGKLSFPDNYRVPSGDTMIDVSGKVYRKYSLRYIEFPLLFKMKTLNFRELRFFGQLGFIPAFNIRSHATDVVYPDSGTSFQNEPDISPDVNIAKLSVYIGGGVEYHLDRSTFLVLGLGFNNSFTDVFSGYNTKLKAPEDAISNYLEFTLGIIF